jgi:hypothetical protein
MHETERVIMVNLTNTRARARDIAATINREVPLGPAFTRASQTVATVVVLLDTLLGPSTDEVDKVYHQLKELPSTLG